MRRRPIILLLLATASLGGAAIALADPPTTGLAVKALGEQPDAQVGPSIAVNPAGGAPNIQAVALGTDWQQGVLAPQSAYSAGSIVAATGATSWATQSILPHTGSDRSGGSPEVTWGPGNKVYAVEIGRDSSAPTDPCAVGAGVYLSVSPNGGASWANPIELDTGGLHKSFSDPAIAYSALTGHIYVTYTKTDPCTGGAGSTSVIRMISLTADNGTGTLPIVTVSPGSANAQFKRPSIAVLPNGSVAVAYYDASQNPGQVLVTTCSPTIPTDLTSDPECSPSVDQSPTPVTVAPSVLDPGTVGNLAVHVHPDIAADATGRVIVTWAGMTPTNNMDVFSATSRDYGASFGDPQVVSDNGGSSNQIDPAVAISPTDGRADIAFLDSRYSASGYEVAVASSNRPIAMLQSEAWSPSIPVESTPITPVAPVTPGSPSLGGRIGIAEVPRTTGRPWTLVGWTDTRNVSGSSPRNEDVYSTVLLHGATAPVANDFSWTASKNTTTLIPITATDADADPLTYSIVQQPAQGSASVPDRNRPTISYTAPPALVSDQLKVQVDDGVSSTIVTISVQTRNDPPTIGCDALQTTLDKPLPIPNCTNDVNLDSVTLDATSPVHGQIDRSGGGLTFVPDHDFVGTAFVTLVAFDGTETATKTVAIRVVAPDPDHTPVTIDGASTQTAYTDQPIMFKAATSVDGVDPNKIVWSFGDDTAPPTDQGPSVSHLFPTAGTYTVTARVGDGPPTSVHVFVFRPTLSLTTTALGSGDLMALRVQLGASGKLTVNLLGVRGAPRRTVKLKQGKHTLRMRLPASARARGTVILKLTFKQPNGKVSKVKRAVMLPPA